MTIGKPCQFYHEGGVGERKWVVGWRYGIVREIPGKGRRFGMVRIEIPVLHYGEDPVTHKLVRLAFEKVWIASENVNAVGDTVYHGTTDEEKLEARRKQKQEEQAKADKARAKSAARFHR